ncbi:MAG: hypothetical protein V3V00_01175 [Saprospiraceae bacterium]
MGKGTAASDIHIKQGDANLDGGASEIRFEVRGNSNDFWQIYNSGLFFSFARDGSRIAFVNSAGVLISEVNFSTKDPLILKSLSLSNEKLLNLKVGHSSHASKNKRIAVDVSHFLNEFPEMVEYNENVDAVGINYRKLYLTAISALQEEIKINQQQQKDIDFLKIAILNR